MFFGGILNPNFVFLFIFSFNLTGIANVNDVVLNSLKR